MASSYLCPGFSGIAHDIAFFVHDFNASNGLQTSGGNNIHSTNVGCGCEEENAPWWVSLLQWRNILSGVKRLSLMAMVPHPSSGQELANYVLSRGFGAGSEPLASHSGVLTTTAPGSGTPAGPVQPPDRIPGQIPGSLKYGPLLCYSWSD